jgi:hypothetical protein
VPTRSGCSAARATTRSPAALARTRLDGAQGADVLHAADGRQDELKCGTESDSYDADELDTVPGDCELRVVAPAPAEPAVTPTDPGTAPLPGPVPAPFPPGPPPVDVVSGTVTLSHGAVPLRVSCGMAASCSGWIAVRLLPRRTAKATAAKARRPVIAKRRYRLAAGQTKSLRAHISRRGRERVLQRRRARCSVRISTVAADGTKQTTTSRITIKAGGTR